MKVSGQSDRWIQPGKTEQYVVTVAVGQHGGKVIKSVTATTNDRENPTVKLDCEANVLTAMKSEPENINLGTVRRDAGAQKTVVKITRGDGGPMKPKVLTTGSPQIEAELNEIEPGEKYELVVTATPPWPNGMLRGSVQLETGVEQEPTRSIPVFATIPPRLQTTPQRFTLRPENPSDLKLVARLSWDDDKPGKALEASVNDAQLTARIEDQNNQQVVVLDVPAGYKGRPGLTTQVLVKTDDAAAPTLQIPIYLMGNQPRPTPVGGPPQASAAVQPAEGGQPTAVRALPAGRLSKSAPAGGSAAAQPTTQPAPAPTPAPTTPQ